jgi:hypothetical protein
MLWCCVLASGVYEKLEDPETGEFYYHNKRTGESQVKQKHESQVKQKHESQVHVPRVLQL